VNLTWKTAAAAATLAALTGCAVAPPPVVHYVRQPAQEIEVPPRPKLHTPALSDAPEDASTAAERKYREAFVRAATTDILQLARHVEALERLLRSLGPKSTPEKEKATP
jgi:hypothetical protein